MKDADSDHDQTDELAPTCEISDAALEAIGSTYAAGAVTLIYGSYCFTCSPEDALTW